MFANYSSAFAPTESSQFSARFKQLLESVLIATHYGSDAVDRRDATTPTRDAGTRVTTNGCKLMVSERLVSVHDPF